MSLKKYEVTGTVKFVSCCSIEVEATSKREALEKAYNGINTEYHEDIAELDGVYLGKPQEITEESTCPQKKPLPN